MREFEIQAVQVEISEDAMLAYLLVLEPLPGEIYSVAYLKRMLEQAGVTYGIKEEVLQNIITNRLYEMRLLVAEGVPAVDGTDGTYQYHFQMNPDKKPKIREDGSVDYWSLNLIQTVVKGQVIAIYEPAKQGMIGMTVTGQEIAPKHGKELPPLRGKGFERTDDNLTYVATTDGKIELVNDRICINNFHEIFSNIDMLFGNIDFAGDVVIHGNICSGMSVKAGGTLTVDGVVEGATVWAGKDIVLRGGVLGDGRAEVSAKGNIYARFFEYAKVDALGSIEADAFLQCEVECRKNILIKGKKGAIVGGRVHAIEGIEANEIGNESEIDSMIEVGIDQSVYKEMAELRQSQMELRENVRKLEDGIRQFDALGEQRGVSYKNDPRRAALLRAMIRDSSMEKMKTARLEELSNQETASKNASVKVNRTIYPGTTVTINGVKTVVKEEQFAVEYVRRLDKIILKGESIVG